MLIELDDKGTGLMIATDQTYRDVEGGFEVDEFLDWDTAVNYVLAEPEIIPLSTELLSAYALLMTYQGTVPVQSSVSDTDMTIIYYSPYGAVAHAGTVEEFEVRLPDIDVIRTGAALGTTSIQSLEGYATESWVAEHQLTAGDGVTISGTTISAILPIRLSIDLEVGTYDGTVIASDERITAAMSVFSTAIERKAMGGDWTFTTANGKLALTGTVNAQATIVVILGLVA